MNTNIITRQIGIAMLAFGATFLQTTLFASSHFGPAADAPAVHASARLADGNTVSGNAADARG